jgi:hypothetical protein
MKSEYMDWFLNNIKDKEFTKRCKYDRKYQFYNFSRNEVPFDSNFHSYLKSFVNDIEFEYDTYHIHKWKVGSFFNEHIDNRANKKFAYVCELRESKCKTKLLIEDTEVAEAWFDVYTKHTVPVITDGERISLTIFAKKINNKKLI